jgi:hypothetical protein
VNRDVAAVRDQARRVGTIPVLFETWGNRTGTDPAPYGTEQAWITSNYRFVAQPELAQWLRRMARASTRYNQCDWYPTVRVQGEPDASTG